MASNEKSSFHITASRGRIFVDGPICRHVDFLADKFFTGFPKLPNPRLLDFLHIAAGAYAVDRLIKKRPSTANSFGTRSIDIVVDVSDIDFWKSPEIRGMVAGILRFLSDDEWGVDFKAATVRPGDCGYQSQLAIEWPYQPERIALYSGGLDSAAGLANKLISGAEKYLLMTVGHQSGLRKLATKQTHDLAGILNLTTPIHAVLVSHISGGKNTRIRDQELTQRTRAFLFCACSAIVANAFEINEIELFENGVGAINFPPMTGMLFGGLSTRGAHPTFLNEMSMLTTLICGRSVKFVLPFIEMTKGEMLKALRSHGLEDWIKTSKSCVHTSWRFSGKGHCGKCPACIERRQAFFVAGIPDEGMYSYDILSDDLKSGKDIDYFRLYTEDAVSWLNRDPRVLRRMNNHLRFTEISRDLDQSICDVQTRYANEIVSTYINGTGNTQSGYS